MPGVPGETHEGQHQRYALLPLPRRDAGDPQRHADVLGGRQHRQQAERLEDVRHSLPAQPHPVTLAHRGHVLPGHAHRAAVRRVEAAHDVEQRGLARP
jgi:hypothetical protein